MCCQIGDLFRYQGHMFKVVYTAGDGGNFVNDFFARFHLEPFEDPNGSSLGYSFVYAVLDSKLIVDKVGVNMWTPSEDWYAPVIGPTILGIEPTRRSDNRGLFNNNYEGLLYPVPFTGKMMIGRELAPMGDEDFKWNFTYSDYETVIELTFKEGLLINELDRSAEMKVIRDQERKERAEREQTHRSRKRSFSSDW